MTPRTHPHEGSFRLSMLINDTRYRSITFQIIALFLLCLAVGYLISNLFSNLRAAGLNISYSFLGEPAGYDINQRPIEYTSQSTHLRASIVGVLNTLIVAVLACATATVFGVIAGVLRLSKNWLVSKIMAIYVEVFRNVPVLIWIIIIFTVMTAAMPAPKAFRGANAESSMLFDMFAFTNRGIYIPAPQFSNPLFANDFLNWILVIVILVGSFFCASTLEKRAAAQQASTGQRPTTWHLTLATWLVPVASLMFLMGLYSDYPALKGFNFKGGLQIRGSLIALWFALAIYTGAFIAENVRAGILSVSSGQTEAAAALGLRPNRIMNLVILPQALRVIIPPMISHYLNITKNSSLAIAVGYMDVTGTLGGITLNQTGRAIETILLLMVFYLTISLSISVIMNFYNNSVKLKER